MKNPSLPQFSPRDNASRTTGTVLIALLLGGATLGVPTAQAQSTYYRPLTLAYAQTEDSGGDSPTYRPLTLAYAQTEDSGGDSPTAVSASAADAQALTAHSPGEAHHGKTADEIAKELSNPNNSIAKLTFKNQFRMYTGDLPDADDQWNYTLLFQPVFPFNLGETSSGAKQVLFTRPAFPLLVEQPVPKVRNGQLEWDDTTALGDIGFDVAYGQTTKSGVIWAAGMTGTLPTATDSDVAGKQLRLGPEMVIAKGFKHGILGIFPSHQWDVTGWSDQYFSTTQIQPVAVWTPGKGFTIQSKGLYTYDWRSEQWTVPVNLAVAKTLMLGGRPWQIELEVNYYVEQADAFGPEWMIGFNVTPIVNNFIANLIQGKK